MEQESGHSIHPVSVLASLDSENGFLLYTVGRLVHCGVSAGGRISRPGKENINSKYRFKRRKVTSIRKEKKQKDQNSSLRNSPTAMKL